MNIPINFLKRLIGKIYGVWCSKCASKLEHRGWYQEKSQCPNCGILASKMI